MRIKPWWTYSISPKKRGCEGESSGSRRWAHPAQFLTALNASTLLEESSQTLHWARGMQGQGVRCQKKCFTNACAMQPWQKCWKCWYQWVGIFRHGTLLLIQLNLALSCLKIGFMIAKQNEENWRVCIQSRVPLLKKKMSGKEISREILANILVNVCLTHVLS